MQSDALVEAMARALFGQNVRDGGGNPITFDTCHECHRISARGQALAALAALRAARPDVAAVLSAEAVAVPKVATPEMIDATGYVGRDNEMRGLFFIMATASPYAPPGDAP